MKNSDFQFKIREPLSSDGMAVHKLIDRCPPLDTNSVYCNLLQCSHYATTSAAAFLNEKLVGFISGYILPEQKNTLFIWQVAVDKDVRGFNLATSMLQHILIRSQCKDINAIETTITESNTASWKLFKGLARKLSSEIKSHIVFEKELHFNGCHEAECLVRIEPLQAPFIFSHHKST